MCTSRYLERTAVWQYIITQYPSHPVPYVHTTRMQALRAVRSRGHTYLDSSHWEVETLLMVGCGITRGDVLSSKIAFGETLAHSVTSRTTYCRLLIPRFSGVSLSINNVNPTTVRHGSGLKCCSSTLPHHLSNAHFYTFHA